jgi:hypothetical protein
VVVIVLLIAVAAFIVGYLVGEARAKGIRL